MKSRDAYLIKKGSYNYENSGSRIGNGAVTAAVDMVNQGHDVKLYCRNSSIKNLITH